MFQINTSIFLVQTVHCEALSAAGEKWQGCTEVSGLLQIYAEWRMLVHENPAGGNHELDAHVPSAKNCLVLVLCFKAVLHCWSHILFSEDLSIHKIHKKLKTQLLLKNVNSWLKSSAAYETFVTFRLLQTTKGELYSSKAETRMPQSYSYLIELGGSVLCFIRQFEATEHIDLLHENQTKLILCLRHILHYLKVLC